MNPTNPNTNTTNANTTSANTTNANTTNANTNPANEEVKKLGTHANGATEMFKTRTTPQPQSINPPVVENPGPYDTRTGNYE